VRGDHDKVTDKGKYVSHGEMLEICFFTQPEEYREKPIRKKGKGGFLKYFP
jgi:hypothetical protein